MHQALTTSEARAEACMIVLRMLLRLLRDDLKTQIAHLAHDEAADIGLPAILEEVCWLLDCDTPHA